MPARRLATQYWQPAGRGRRPVACLCRFTAVSAPPPVRKTRSNYGFMNRGPACILEPMMKKINLPLPAELLRAIDEARGDVARTVWIRKLIERALRERKPR